MKKRSIKAVFVVALIAVFVALVYVFVFALCKVSGETNAEYEAAHAAADTPAPEEPEPHAFVRWPVPLSDEVQAHIMEECRKHGIDPAIVFAQIGVESQYRADAIGDHGASYGLMQIQPGWHEERMRSLGVTDLLDPIENTTVGIDILADCLDRGNGIEWALSFYSGNGGAECEYARLVLCNAEQLLEGVTVIQK